MNKKQFVERRIDKDRMIKANMKKMFAPFDNMNGKISNFNEEEMKILLENNNYKELEKLLEKHYLVTFRFNKDYDSVVTHAAPVEIDKSDDLTQLRFKFFNMDPKYHTIISNIINSYGI